MKLLLVTIVALAFAFQTRDREGVPVALWATEGTEDAVGQAFSPTCRYFQGVFNGAVKGFQSRDREGAVRGFQNRDRERAAPQTPPTQTSGRYAVALRLPSDGLYAGEEVQIEFRLTDSSLVDPLIGATPIIRARTRSEIWMPAMPSMARIIEVAHVEGVPGEYGVHPTFPHGGEYLLELAIEPPGAEMFKVRFPLQVADTPPGKRRNSVRPWSVELRSSPKTTEAGNPAELALTIRHKDNPRERLENSMSSTNSKCIC
jgi:hypothetical protein